MEWKHEYGTVEKRGVVFCLFIVLVVIFGSYFRASEVSTFFGALAGTPLLVHVFNRLAPRKVCPARRRGINRGKDEAVVFELDDAHE
jgi:hypothetical protein